MTRTSQECETLIDRLRVWHAVSNKEHVGFELVERVIKEGEQNE